MKKAGINNTKVKGYLQLRYLHNFQMPLTKVAPDMQPFHFCYFPPQGIFNPYRGVYGARYIFFVNNGTSVPWIIGVNNFHF